MSEVQESQASGQDPRMTRSVAAVAEALGVTEHSLHERLDFEDVNFAWRRLFAEFLGTFLLVFVAAGGSVVNARFGGHAVPLVAQVVAPGMMVMSIILFMGGVSGAHLNPVVSIAFALRRDFAWKHVPGYIASQFGGALLAMLLLVELLGKHGAAGLTLPGSGISTTTALVWEVILTAGLVSVILGTASGAQAIGWGAAIGVGGYIALAGLIGAPVSGASMNPARSRRFSSGASTPPGGRTSSARSPGPWSPSVLPGPCGARAAGSRGAVPPLGLSATCGDPGLSRRLRLRTDDTCGWSLSLAAICRVNVYYGGGRPAGQARASRVD